MKGFPEQPEGAIGEWYQKVNSTVRTASQSKTVNKLISILGRPDKIEGDEIERPSNMLKKLGSMLHFGDEKAESVFVYVDPYRPRIRYKFGIIGKKVDSHWRETISEENIDK